MRIVHMTVADWIAVADNPIQRDTERHARVASRTHLKKPSESHALVAAAELPDGTMYKLDGHTRAYLWQNDKLPRPADVIVTVFDVATVADVIELYKHFDNPAAAESARDRLAGAYRLHNIVPTSPLLTDGGVSTALDCLSTGGTRALSGLPAMTIYDAVLDWKSELLLLDALEHGNKKAMPSPLIVAALATYRKRGPIAAAFWAGYLANKGVSADGSACGIETLRRLVQSWRDKSTLAVNRTATFEQAGKALSCVEAWLEGRKFVKQPNQTDLVAYLANTIPLSQQNSGTAKRLKRKPLPEFAPVVVSRHFDAAAAERAPML